MKKKWIMIIFSSFLMLLLSGCDEVGDLLDKAGQLLDQQLEEETAEIEGDDQNLEEESENLDQENLVEDDEEAPSDDQNESADEATESSNEQTGHLPFDEWLTAKGFERIELPNGIYLDVPYHWVLVEDNSTDHNANQYEAQFYFRLPLDVETVAHYVGTQFENVTHEHYGEGNDLVHLTEFSQDYGYEQWDGSFEYYTDDDGVIRVSTIILASSDGETYGEDPDTMVSEEELAEMQGTTQVAQNRTRSLPDDYEQTLSQVRDNDDLFDQSQVVSSIDKIRSGEIDLLHVRHGFPRIFPYEWYLVNELDMPTYSSWSGTFLTDTSINEAIIKHLDFLEDYQADIHYVAIEGIIKPNVLAELEFSFNDDYGTGSWHGTSVFFIAPEGEGTYPNQVGMTVDLEFSDELLN